MDTRKLFYLAGMCGVLLLAALFMTHPGAAQAPAQESITLVLQAPAYQLIPTADGYTSIEAEGCSISGQPGRPLLPHQLSDVALPPDVAWDSLSLVVRDVRTAAIPGTFRLRTAVPDQSVNGPAPDYGPALAQEPPIAQIVETGQMRKWHVARVSFWPFQYDPAAGQLRAVEQATVELRFSRTGKATDTALLADTVLDNVAAERLVNYEQARSWYPPAAHSPTVTYDYVIITTNAIETNSTKLAAFVAHKQTKGHSVLVVTEDNYGGLTGQPPNGREEKVRQWLKNNYVAYNIEFVLLVGNPTPGSSGATDLPMKMCWPRRGAGSDEESPTDYFFADLTGDWNKDGDAYFGEWDGDYDVTGGVDFMPEVYVGRIPFYGTYADLDGILQKTIDYGNAADIGWRKTILLPMSFSAAGYDGAPLAQQMWDDYLNGAGYSRWRQYQQGTGACGLDSSYASEEELRGGTVVRDRWAANDYGIVCWWGHGIATSAAVGYDGCWDGTLFDNGQTASLDDSHPAFTYQTSCTNGYPENTGNLQYAVLKRGGIATVSATRVSWFNTGVGYGDFDGSTTNSGIGYEYVERVVNELTASEALYGAKSSMTPESNTRLMNFYDFNLYGDPAIGITASGSSGENRVYLPVVYKRYATGGVLWDQPLSTINQNAYVDQEFTDFPTYSSYLADDFTNGSPWTVSAIFVPGNGWNGFSSLLNATALHWRIYADCTGVPCGDPSGGGSPPFWSLNLAPNNAQVTITSGSGGYPSDTLLQLTTPVSVPAGHWWLVFYPSLDFGSYGQYGRQPADTNNGYPGQFINPGGAFGYGTFWQAWTVLGAGQHDIAFRLEGP
jgi:Peptidase family C25/Propeptide_C25